MRSNRFAPGSTGHDIIDDVALKNQDRNTDLFLMCKDMPPYFGQTNIGEEKVTLTPIKRRGKLGNLKLVADVVEGVRNLTLKDTPASITLVEEGGGTRRVPVHPEIVKFVKTCTVCSYNANSDFCDVLTFFVHEVTGNCEHLILPIDYHAANKTQKVLTKELNEFLKELCDENGIEYGEVLPTKKTKRANPMMETVSRIGEK